MEPRLSPNNDPETRIVRLQLLSEQIPAEEQLIRKSLRAGFTCPVVRECKLELIQGGGHDDSFDEPPTEPQSRQLAA